MSTLKETIATLVETELNILNTPTIYFDMDGVLADFDSGVLQGNPRAETARQSYMALLKNFPELMSITDDEIKKRMAGPQADPGMKALKKAWSNYRELKFIQTNKAGFFLNLPILPGAGEMLARAAALTGRKPGILTAPVDFESERCAAEKRQWMDKNFPGMFSDFVCTQDKHEYAHANSVLIDDRTKFTTKFENAGGTAILHKNAADSMAELENLLKARGLPV